MLVNYVSIFKRHWLKSYHIIILSVFMPIPYGFCLTDLIGMKCAQSAAIENFVTDRVVHSKFCGHVNVQYLGDIQ